RRTPAGKGGDGVVSGVCGVVVVRGPHGDDPRMIPGAGYGSRLRSAVSRGGDDGDAVVPGLFDDPADGVIPPGTAGRAAEGEGNDPDVVPVAVVDAPLDPGNHIGQVPGSSFVQHLDAHQPGPG